MLYFRALILVTFVVVAHCDLQLKLLHVLLRHGDKIPQREYENYPNDPHANHSYYPSKNGGLSKAGMLREYKIGTILRDRYSQYLGPSYRPSMVWARATQHERTQMSLQLVLAGLFPPSDEAQNLNESVPWPSSTFSIPVEQDYRLSPDACPQYDEELKRVLKYNDIKEIVSKHKPIIDYLTQHTGKNITELLQVYFVYNRLKEQSAENLTIPEWTKTVYPNAMMEMVALNYHLRSYTKKMSRLNGGLLLRKITDDMKDLKNNTLNPTERKAFFFSAHGFNIVAFARAIGTNYPAIPLNGATFMIETLSDNNNRYFVKILLWTGETERLILQKIPGCDEICPLENFLEIVKDDVAQDEEYRCWPSENKTV